VRLQLALRKSVRRSPYIQPHHGLPKSAAVSPSPGNGDSPLTQRGLSNSSPNSISGTLNRNKSIHPTKHAEHVYPTQPDAPEFDQQNVFQNPSFAASSI
jgi:hypothetical protein